MQYATEKEGDPLEIRIVTGADGSFTLYEDGNDSYDYEGGAKATIEFKWEDDSRILTIGERIGQFPGMTKNREFKIVLIEKGRVKGFQPVDEPDRKVIYKGESTQIKF
jgi:alpha-D-xyloside xylohydrolase